MHASEETTWINMTITQGMRVQTTRLQTPGSDYDPVTGPYKYIMNVWVA